MLGAFAKATGLTSLSSLNEAIKETFKGTVANKNIEAAMRAYKEVRIG
jgi:Pyruvate/2-oxoacid:ferredoxin oxidoreductase gamma subunit